MSFPASLDSLVEIRTAVLVWLDTHGCEPDTAHELALACWELCANAIEHALDRRHAVIEVTGELLGDAVWLTVRDHGGWREPRPTPGRGLGLRLAAGLSDNIAVRRGLDGTRVTLTRRLRSTVSA
jgi:anti-sigma regulatory factor (Ser/Thr protein kinase)